MHHYHHCGTRFYHGHHGPFHKMPPWFSREMFGGHRAERGDVRYLILDALKEGEGHGYQIIQTIKEKSGGRYQPSPGAIYPTLQMLSEEGLLETRQDGNKVVYKLTNAGFEELKQHLDEVEDAYDRLGFVGGWEDIDFSRIGPLLKRLSKAVKGAVRRNLFGPERFDEVMKILDDAVTKIEKMLSR